MESRFELRDFLKVFSLALILYVFFEGVLSFTPGIEEVLDTLHPSISFLVTYLFLFVIMFCPLWLFVVEKYNASFEDFGLKKVGLGKLLKTVFLSYGGYLVLMFLLGIILTATDFKLPGYEAQNSYLPLFGEDALGLLIGFLWVGGIAPFLEEIFFRGFIFKVFIKTWPLWLGSVLSAALFALVHMQLQNILPLFILGLLLNYNYQKTNSLWTSIAFHSLNNICAFSLQVFLGFNPELLNKLADLQAFLYTYQIS